ncbi:hypothetical protein WGT02_02810 [Rhizobium sp. T1470]|uniref:hypothetical protein n=1 Tax=unclassified Rhizobium TaxID=2613769 RepID=UPI001AAEA149|nr:hypothetical protein [Rhizobium sp. T1473]MCA0804185.1 hypothetical protein [Rhizobium sp. T1473]
MLGDGSISIADATSVDRARLVEILSGEHVQAAMPEVVEREIIERTVASNLEISGNEPSRLVFIKAQVGEITAGLGLARRMQYGKYALEVVIGDGWLRRGIASSQFVELNRRCRELGAAATYSR